MLADGTDSNVFRCCSHQASRGVALLFPSRRFSSKTAGSSGYGVCRRLVHARDVTNGASNVKKNLMKCVHLRVKSDPGGKQVNCFTSVKRVTEHKVFSESFDFVQVERNEWRSIALERLYNFAFESDSIARSVCPLIHETRRR